MSLETSSPHPAIACLFKGGLKTSRILLLSQQVSLLLPSPSLNYSLFNIFVFFFKIIVTLQYQFLYLNQHN